MSKVGLKPCPFCGNENILFNRGYSPEIRNGFYLICGKCGISQALCGTKKACINKWNKRVDIKRPNIDSAVDLGFLQEWYQDSVSETDEPVWTDEHLRELTGDFILIPKEALMKEGKE